MKKILNQSSLEILSTETTQETCLEILLDTWMQTHMEAQMPLLILKMDILQLWLCKYNQDLMIHSAILMMDLLGKQEKNLSLKFIQFWQVILSLN